jgi:ATP-binding cassette subfamily B protein/subfamily B ATP-binding cassette protein MsbA
MRNVTRVLRYLVPYWRLGAASVVITVFAAGVSLLLPWPLKILVDNVLSNQPAPPPLDRLLGASAADRVHFLILAVVAGVLVALIDNALNVAGNYVDTRLHQYMVLDFRSDLFQHAQRLSLAFHDQRRAGQLIYAINYFADEATTLALSVQPLGQSFITLVGMFGILILFDVQLALLSLVVLPFLYYSVGYYATHIQGRLRQVKGMEGESLAIIHEAISMLRVIVAFGREGYEYGRFRKQAEQAVDARIKVTVRQTLFSLVVNMTTAIGTALVIGLGAYHALTGQITIGQLLVAIAYLAAVYKPLETISYTLGTLQEKLVGTNMAYELMDTVPGIKDVPGSVTVERSGGRVAFQHVRFSYTGRVDTLKDISFEAKPGHIVAIVGPTGAGKSTLVSLLPRFYDPQGGRILLDGRDIRSIRLKSLRDQISVVLQEPLLFSGCIRDNIRYGRLEASMDEVIAAAQGANAHDFIMNLPDQYETQIGERGVQLSGGERQRIAVARAFLRDSPILILDEPTSSIDSKTEAVILDALTRLMAGRTTFMIAHRLSTVRDAQLILVTHHGEIVERGTHDELIATNGLYRQLYDMQTGVRPLRTAPLARLA